jgi:hypothetical protein
VLRKLKKHRLLLYLGAILFAFSGVLHPLFHPDGGCCNDRRTITAQQHSDHRRHDRNAPLHQVSHCPVCAGLFSSAEVPAPPVEPAVPEQPAVYVCILSTPHQPEFAVYRQVRAPPVLS